MNGTPRILTLSESDMDRFDEKVSYNLSTNACWEWQGSRDSFGYGMFRLGKQVIRAHRVSYAIANDCVMPDGVVMHKCDNPSCVRPSHLELGTRATNNADRDAKGRQVAPQGVKHGMAKLNPDAVRDIRNTPRSPGVCIKLAKKYGVALGTIYNLRRRNAATWIGV